MAAALLCARHAEGGTAAAEPLQAHTEPLPPAPQNDLQLQREKVRRKAAIVGRQEEELAARDAAADEAQQRARTLQRDLERATEDTGGWRLAVLGCRDVCCAAPGLGRGRLAPPQAVMDAGGTNVAQTSPRSTCAPLPRADALRAEVAGLRGRLEDSRAQVASNEQMIRWLNNQITDTQLHYSAGSAGLLASRFSYRPGAPVPPVGTGSTATGAGGASTAAAAGMGGAMPAPARLPVSTYRTPGVGSTVGSTGATGGPTPPSAGSAAAPATVGGGGAAPARSGFRSNFYATHFGSGASLAGAGSGAAAARSLDLGAAGTTPTATAPSAPPAATGAAAGPAAAAQYLGSRFEAPTFRMSETAAGRMAVPVTSGS